MQQISVKVFFSKPACISCPLKYIDNILYMQCNIYQQQLLNEYKNFVKISIFNSDISSVYGWNMVQAGWNIVKGAGI